MSIQKKRLSRVKKMQAKMRPQKNNRSYAPYEKQQIPKCKMFNRYECPTVVPFQGTDRLDAPGFPNRIWPPQRRFGRIYALDTIERVSTGPSPERHWLQPHRANRLSRTEDYGKMTEDYGKLTEDYGKMTEDYRKLTGR